uniref:CRIB domain-containing protein n=1 Tax=Panagrolaimus sp. JU765 TaxID=591449 RepID=A0AC34PWI1_9BILA
MESLLPKLTAKVLDSDSGDKSKKKHRNSILKSEISSPTGFRHLAHISSMHRNAPDQMIGIEIDGKLIYVDSKYFEQLQNCQTDPVLEGDECGIDASSPIKERPSKMPHLSEISNQVFNQTVDSTDTPTIPIKSPLPISSKKRAAPPPPQSKKPALKDLETENDKFSEKESVITTIPDTLELDSETKQLIEQLQSLRSIREQLEVEVKRAEEKLAEKLNQKQKEFEPFVQVSVVEMNETKSEWIQNETKQETLDTTTQKSLEEAVQALDEILENAENETNDQILPNIPKNDVQEEKKSKPIPRPRKPIQFDESTVVRL